MAPYVYLQQQIIDLLFRLQKNDPEKLLLLVEHCRSEKPREWIPYLRGLGLRGLGLHLEYSAWRKTCNFSEIILEQIDDSDNKIRICNLLGSPLYCREKTYTLKDWVQKRGGGENLLRSDNYAQPSALKEGDVLITGERILSSPREGGNGAVFVHLSSYNEKGVWLSFPSRTALALVGCHNAPIPDGLLEE